MAKNKTQSATDGAQSAQETTLETTAVTAVVSEEKHAEQPAAETNPPNIILSAKADPVSEGAIGFRGIVLPDVETQRRGWYEPKARYILQMYGTAYKVPVEKGKN